LKTFIRNNILKHFLKFIVVFFSILVMVLGVAGVTKHAITGGNRFPENVTFLVVEIANLPSRIFSVINLVSHLTAPDGITNTYTNLSESLNSPKNIGGFLLISRIAESGNNEVLLVDLENRLEKIIFSGESKVAEAQYTDAAPNSIQRRQVALSSRHRVWNPHLSKSGALTYICPWNDLVSVDLLSQRELWRVKGAFHHSVEADEGGNLWACGASSPSKSPGKNGGAVPGNFAFEDGSIIKISPSGIILKVISIHDLLCGSGFEYLVYGTGNINANLDPFHLNQVTPIKFDCGIFKSGQLLVSLRNLSTILLVDPELNRIIWSKSGPWMNQHCVMPVDCSKISVLDNHSFASGFHWLDQRWKSEIICQDVNTGKSTKIEFEDSFLPKIAIEGRAIPLDDGGWLIEDSSSGLVVIFKQKKLVYKWQNNYSNGTVGVTSWSRFLVNQDVPAFLR
jgi:hypothetical protein